ncbi:MAG: 16S rRNA (guanine(966)-N(2))-methyltransferase RsmD [bacterium]|nr:16S rRNA (guanine(966)-N(2))-methyltransferase RsmD [Deltaproteobacteria bacterium]MCP4903651.1 16S rRNA (guanine(966)-N(2))-methyltransferase RsmD [bacterium]
MRIISGRLGGRDLGKVPDGVRPTSDRVRESLFSALGSIEGLCVLDLFAGTGALGLEAYSRGARRVVFVERSRRVVRALRRRLANLDLDPAQHESISLLEAPALRALRRLSGDAEAQFDLVFLDPPYADGDREETLEALFGSEILGPEGRVVVEGPKRHPLPPLPGMRVVNERRYGDTLLTWLEASTVVGG